MNKLSFFAFALTGFFVFTVGCKKIDTDQITPTTSTVPIPTQAQNFVGSNFSGYQIADAYKDDLCDDVYYYEVELEDGPGPDIDLYFDLDWNYRFKATEINNSALPQAVLDAVQSQFPGYAIEQGSAERLDFPDGTVQYSFELEKAQSPDIQVVMESGGGVVCTETQDDDDDDTHNNGNQGAVNNIPPGVMDFISGNFSGYQITDMYKDDLCDDVYYYEVELEDGPGPDIDLYFDLDWNYRFKATEINNSALPQAVLDAVQSQFPGYTIEQGSAERLDFPDGTVQYALTLVTIDEDEDQELVINADGSLICAED